MTNVTTCACSTSKSYQAPNKGPLEELEEFLKGLATTDARHFEKNAYRLHVQKACV